MTEFYKIQRDSIVLFYAYMLQLYHVFRYVMESSDP
jgi:hypothetical protein